MSIPNPEQFGRPAPVPNPPTAQPVPNQPIPSAPNQAVVPNQPVLPNQPVAIPQSAAPNQPVVAPNQPILPGNVVAPSHPVIPNQPVVAGPPTTTAVPNQPVIPNQPVVTGQPTGQNRPLPVNPTTIPAASPTLASVPKSDAPTRTQQPSGSRPIPVSQAKAGPQSKSAGSRPIPVSSSVTAPAAEDPDEEKNDVTEAVVRSAPPWLVSLGVHMGLMIILGLLTLTSLQDQPIEIEVKYAEEIGVQLDDNSITLDSFDMSDATEPIFAEDLTAVDDPLAAMPELNTALLGVTKTMNIEAPTIGHALSGREKGSKQALLGKYGGNATTEAAVKRGLEWLARYQQRDGKWSLIGRYDNGANIENHCSATAMALLAFQGAGNTHKVGEFKKNVATGMKALLDMQDADGYFYHEEANVPQHSLYSQAQATIALCELYGMTKDKQFRKPAQLAVQYAVEAQSPEGGWRYYAREDSDLSVTGWFVIALQSAMMADLKVPEDTLTKVGEFLNTVQKEGGARYVYQPGKKVSATMTAEALLCRQYLGWKRDDPRLVSGVEYVLNHPIDWQNDQNVYYWYYAAQTTHHMEGEYWERWNNVMRDVIPKNQLLTGQERGSWSPLADQWGASHGGRLFTTCMCIYMLEVYYRHLPIYQYRPN